MISEIELNRLYADALSARARSSSYTPEQKAALEKKALEFISEANHLEIDEIRASAARAAKAWQLLDR